MGKTQNSDARSDHCQTHAALFTSSGSKVKINKQTHRKAGRLNNKYEYTLDLEMAGAAA